MTDTSYTTECPDGHLTQMSAGAIRCLAFGQAQLSLFQTGDQPADWTTIKIVSIDCIVCGLDTPPRLNTAA